MKILKYKKSTGGRYKVLLEDGREYQLYEEVILQYQLLIHKEVDDKTLEDINLLNQEWDVYYTALRSIESHMKSTYELKEWLIRKEYPTDLVEKAIDKLIKQGYLDDRNYAKSYIYHQMVSSAKGPFRIQKELNDKKIDDTIILEELQVFNEEEQINKIKMIIEKEIHSNHNKGGLVLKQKIYNDLKNYGYDSFMIQNQLANYSFNNNQELAEKEYQKLYRKYSRKYEGEELNRIIRDRLYKKGLVYEEE